MTDLQKERENLAKADHDIAEGEQRVTRQILLVERLTQDGHDTTEAQKLLRNFEETLAQWRWHRQLILEEIARLEGSAPTVP